MGVYTGKIPGTQGIGDAIIAEYAEITTSVVVSRLLPPTECTVNRLAAYYRWNDPQGLDQATCVALQCNINLDRIEAWFERKGAIEKLRDFVEELGVAQGDEQGPASITGIRVLTSLDPAIFLALAIWIARGYPLTRAAPAKILEQPEARDGER